MNPKVDTKAMMASIPMFVSIDEELANFYILIKEKDIEPKTLQDLERVEKFFNKTLNTILELINNSSYENVEKVLLKSKLIIDFHADIAEKFNFDFLLIPSAFGPYNQNLINKSMEDLQKIM